MLTGVVSRFDASRGLGDLTGADGRHWPFHCVEIADGSRHIDVGVPVWFGLAPKLGRLEAVTVTKVPGETTT
jgi:CspA family cold shock protein